MFSKICAVLVIFVGVTDGAKPQFVGIVGTPIARARPCDGNDDIEAVFEAGLAPEDENRYTLQIHVELPNWSRVKIKFDSEATATLSKGTDARIKAYNDLTFDIHFYKAATHLSMLIKGPSTGAVPYPSSIVINGGEFCEHPQPGFLDGVIQGYKDTAHVSDSIPQGTCGRRKVVHTELIVNGQPTKPGDWPWHAALYRLENESIRYICGGTLIAKNFVLTAGHCVTINGVPVLPEIMSVIFGKYNLKGGDIASQEREVHEIIVHEEYYHRRLDNDIALIKLKTEAIYDDYVQPACLWNGEAYKKMPPGIVYGTVVGWGLNHTRQLSNQLHQVALPKISDSTCIKSKPDFFGKMLNSRKFCAGYRNGTSACNGDSGGGFMVFVPDVSGDTSANATGSWHIQGIVSLALARPNEAICDPTQYSLFTNVVAFVGWIEERMRTL